MLNPDLIRFCVAPGYSSELIHFYVATELSEVAAYAELDESITVGLHGFDEVLTMIEENIIEDAKTIVGVLAYLTHQK